MQDLDILDDDVDARSIARATHYVAEIDRKIKDGSVRVSVYHKAYSDLWSRYENLDVDTDFLPEFSQYRREVVPVSASASGVELLLRRDFGTVSWWASYSLSKASEVNSMTDGPVELRGRRVPKRFDHRHSLTVDAIFRPKTNWFLGVTWQLRNGWPYTERELDTFPTQFELETSTRYYGDFLAERYPIYHRVDAKISHWYEYGPVQLGRSAATAAAEPPDEPPGVIGVVSPDRRQGDKQGP